MIRFAALNYSSSEEDSQEAQERAATKEAQESEAFMLYNRALSLQRQGSNEKAEDAFRELLDHPFITEALELLGDNVEGSTHPALQLLYSVHKNMANMALHRNDLKTAILSYIEAVKIDTTEVTVWYKIGTIAKQIYNFPLARMGFEVGLQCNPNHWPCLDNVITLLYAMNDYWYCLYYISKTLTKDHGYTKGLVLRNQIFKEDPSLKDTTSEMFKDCDPRIDTVKIDQEDKDEFINEALALAEERRKLAKPKEPDMIKLPKPIQSYTWCNLGEALIALYKMLKSSDPPLSMGRRVDLSAYNGEEAPTDEQPMEAENIDTTVPDDMDVDAAAEQLDPKTVTSLEEILSHLPADQMTELLQSTPPIAAPATTSVQSMNTGISSPMETDFSPVGNVPKIIVTPDNLPYANVAAENLPNSDAAMENLPNGDTAIEDLPNDVMKDSETLGDLAKETVTTEDSSQDETKPDNLPPEFNSPGPESKIITTESLTKELFPPDSLSKSKSSKRKKGAFVEDFGGKRRSARVRNTSKRKEEDCVNFQGLLLTFLPATLRDYDEEVGCEGTLQHVDTTSSGNKNKEGEALVGVENLCDTEDTDVRQLLLGMQKNGGCLDLMMQFVFRLAEKAHYKWPVGLANIYMKVYKMVRNHFDLPDAFSDDEIDDNLIELGQTLLLYTELQLDHWTVTKSRFMSSPRQSQSPGMSQLKDSDLPSFYSDDEYFLAGMISRHDVFAGFWPEYCIRVYWMKARFFLLQNKMEDAVFFFKKTLQCLKETTEVGSGEVIKITLPNCAVHNVLSIDEVEKQLKSLERSQSFEETQRLYDAGEYDKVVECLLKTSLNKIAMPTSGTERRSQLLLLQDSLIKLKDYKRAFLWSEITLDEAVHGYKTSSSSEKEQWADTLVNTCDSLLQILKKDEKSMHELPTSNQARLAHNLIYMIDVEMSVPENCTDMPIGTVLTWIILYKLIEKEEGKSQSDDQRTAVEFDSTIPPSLMLLNIAHEYLGRHAWCTKSEGEFLLFYIKILTSEKSSSELHKEELGQAVEQCFYCLYGHPTKKGRYRHLMDHNAPQIELTWERAEEIFVYFKPKTLPEFDSYKTDAVPGEVEHLLRRICNLVPESQKPMYVMDSLQDYIEGNTDMFDEESIYNPSPVSQELYYLLADYYFKNNEQGKAIKFYMNDICVNPSRLDSWAGMALARMSQLEQKLNSNELKMDFPIHKKSISALRCFRRALQIEENGKLWLEYGSLAYQLFSHAARQLKWKSSFPLGAELELISTNSRQEMLQTSYNCYRKAKECENEEEWLQHYMIGKCLEKMKKPPAEFLKHYEEASECLYEGNAPYPKKIAYAYSTPYLAVEALEMFYRLHASILKILLNKHLSDADYQLFECFVNKAAVSPFACAKQKNEECLNSKEISTTEDKGTDLSKSSQDHTYSKQKQAKMSLLPKPSGYTSLDNSMQSYDSGSQESAYMSSASQSKDISDDVSADSSRQPLELGNTDESLSQSQSSSVNFSTSSIDFSKSETKTLELSAHDMREEITAVKVVDSSKSLSNLNQIGLLKKIDRGTDSPLSVDSSDVFEDEEGNITVTAKIEILGRSSSSEGETTEEKQITASMTDSNADGGTLKPVESFGFVPTITDEAGNTIQEDTEDKSDVKGPIDENSQDNKDSVMRTIENVVSTVDTVNSVVSEVSNKSLKNDIIKNDEMYVNNDQHSTDNTCDIKIDEKNNEKEIVLEQGKDTLKENSNEGQKDSEIDMETDGHKSRIGSLCPDYDSISSEDEELGDKQTNTTRSVEVQLLSNVSLCADYDSLSSENEDTGNGETEQKTKHDGKFETKRDQYQAKTLNTSFDEDKNSVNVLEISEGGISGDVSMQDNKAQTKKLENDKNLSVGEQQQKSDKEMDVEIIDKSAEGQNVNEKSIDKETYKNGTNAIKMEAVEIMETDDFDTAKAEPVVDSKNVDENQVSLGDTATKNTCIMSEVSQMEIDGENKGIDIQHNVKIEDSEEPVMTEHEKGNHEDTGRNENSDQTEAHGEQMETNELNSDKSEVKSKAIENELKEEKDLNSIQKDGETTEKKADIEIKLSGKTGEQLHKLLIEKCMAALHLCLSRFPTHYKSIYRLADVYVNSPYHKNLKFAQDLLLGSSNWQQQSHMPAQGLFGERKQNNFFQGIWRIPIGDIDRSGSFASHMNRSVLLLLRVLEERKELSLMYQIHLSMNRAPEAGKKYLRDSERMLFVKMSFRKCWEIIDRRNKDLTKMTDNEKLEKILMEVYKIWNYGNSSKMKNDIGLDTNKIFGETFEAVMKDKVVADRPLFKQAVDYCQHYNIMVKAQRASQDGQGIMNKSDSSLFSPSRTFPSFSPARQTLLQSPAANNQSINVSTPSSQQKQIISSQGIATDKTKITSNETLTSSKASIKAFQPQVSLLKLSESLKNVQKTDKPDAKKIFQKSFATSPHQVDPKFVQKKPVTKPVEQGPVVETLVEDITAASIFETLIANEFGNTTESQKNKAKTPDEVDGTAKNQPGSISVDKTTKKQTIVVSKSSTEPIICTVEGSKGGLNIVSPEFGSLEVLSPNTPCPDTMKFSIPSKDPKTKTTILITKKKPPLNITEPIEISSSDDEEDKKQEVTSSESTGNKMSSASRPQTTTHSSVQIPKVQANQSKKVEKPPQNIQRSVIQLDDILESAEDSIPSSSASGSVYVPDESSSDSIPSSPEPTNLRLDEVTGLFIPPDVKFFNDNKILDDD